MVKGKSEGTEKIDQTGKPKQKELSAFELSFIAEEMSVLIDGKVDKIYQINSQEFLFQFHIPSKGKRLLRLVLPSLIFLTKVKPETPEKPQGFCMFLRKYLSNARVRDVRQKGFERILEIDFSAKEGAEIKKYIMVIELFRKGNVILCDEKMKIISPLENQFWSDREIKKNEQYKYPDLRPDPFSINASELAGMLGKSDKESIVKFLAIELSLGGVYAEEVCLMADVDKNEKPSKIKDIEKKSEKLVESLRGLKLKKINPKTIFKDELTFIDVTPIDLAHYKRHKSKSFETFDEAIDSEFAAEAVVEQQHEVVSKHDKEIEKVERMIKDQEKTIKNFSVSYEENQRKGELIYENYQVVKDILDQLKKAREKHSWPEIKEKLKGHKLI
ncbi:MAG: NFACT family protein, partial [Nanoarchaeota archaeon]|nr:NFACT family protein [Nanoarchaeota archaeon]